MYSKQKCLLLFIIVLRYPWDKDSQGFEKFDSYFMNDLKICSKCFQNQTEFCRRLRFDFEFDDDLTNNLNVLFGVRQNRVLREIANNSHRIFAKYLARDFEVDSISQYENERQSIEYLSKRFSNESRLDGIQFCPLSRVDRFVEFFEKNYSKFNIWTHMNVDMQPILLPYLHSNRFPVPRIYASCGFTIFQSIEGVPLAHLYSIDFETKLRITLQLLEGAMKFTEGFEGFRIYITDLNMDNVVYDSKKKTVSFVDLDTVLVVDGRSKPDSIHRHEYLDCNDCFAFSPNDICEHGQSDINIFAVCQFLQENLKRDHSKGFLHPIPEEHSELKTALHECVDCLSSNCSNRFKSVVKLQNIIEKILKLPL